MTDLTTNEQAPIEPAKHIFTLNGYLMLFSLIALLAAAGLIAFGIIGGYEVATGSYGTRTEIVKPYWWVGIPLGLLSLFGMCGFKVIDPKDVYVIQLFGTPLGVLDKQGFLWCNPLFSVKKHSYKVKNFETSDLKVNDANGSPIIVAAVVSWKVTNAELVEYELEDHTVFFNSQVEGHLRNIVRKYPYDEVESNSKERDNEMNCNRDEAVSLTLTQSIEEISEEILNSINEDVQKFGIEATAVNFNNLSYAPEIASAMTQKQQAKAIIAAKTELTEGVTDVVAKTISSLDKKEGFTISDADKSSLAKNLTLMLCTNREADAVINIDK